MVLGAVTTGTAAEIAWITESMRRVFPREWDDFAAGIPERHRDLPPAAAYARLFVDPDPTVRAEAARSWCTCEDTHVSLLPGWVPNPRYEDPDFRNVFSRLVSHYWSNDCFLADRPLLAHIDRLDGVPATLLHSRYDVSSPLDIAWDLARSWPTSRLVVLDDAGHGGGSFADEFTAEVGEFGAAHARPLPSSRP
ncbi:proline iminopeptidase [Rhodococcus triatomae]|uniref:Proline iminopeptidase n=2 Tax=Rhodococcus triatomae TaxID=300028 RepID=A0A1G8BCU2_9NOCA|nr:proline iminopeptidase [Rhodococcus triatomae]